MQTIRFVLLDVAKDYDKLVNLFKAEKPDSVIHFAEQRAAPYSMKSSVHKRYTVNNNVNATTNILCAILDSGLDIHLVHLGTMGVYHSFHTSFRRNALMHEDTDIIPLELKFLRDILILRYLLNKLLSTAMQDTLLTRPLRQFLTVKEFQWRFIIPHVQEACTT